MKKQNIFWALAGIFFFAGFILLATNDSAYADEYNLNTAYIVGGVASLIAAGYSLYRVAKLSKPTD